MNKRELVMAAAIKSNGKITQKDIQLGFELVLKCISESLTKGEKITIANFGTFYVKEMKGRNGRNPLTGERIKIPSKKVIKFKVSDGIK